MPCLFCLRTLSYKMKWLKTYVMLPLCPPGCQKVTCSLKEVHTRYSFKSKWISSLKVKPGTTCPAVRMTCHFVTLVSDFRPHLTGATQWQTVRGRHTLLPMKRFPLCAFWLKHFYTSIQPQDVSPQPRPRP